MGRIPPGVGAIDCPQAAVTQGGVVCLSRMAAAVWGLAQHQDPSVYSLSSCLKASVLSLSSGVTVAGCSHGGPYVGICDEVQKSGCPGNIRKIDIGCPHPHKSELEMVGHLEQGH